VNTTWRVLVGDVRDKLAELPAGSVQCCVTSPPYFGLRDYGVAGQIGLERTPAEFVAEMVNLFRLVREAMREDGTLWLNLGDSYAGGAGRWGGYASMPNCKQTTNAGSHGQRSPQDIPAGMKPKDLMGIPWRVALALQADGWYLRSDIIWHKPNPMPESVTDRPTKSHEYIFLLSKSERYFYDAEAIAEPASNETIRRAEFGMVAVVTGRGIGKEADKQPKGGAQRSNSGGFPLEGESRNARSVWTIATAPYPEAHFATFPEALPERCIKAGSKEGDTVLDPFCGSGTTGAVSMRLGRNFVGIELNPAYAELSRKRIGSALPMFSQEVPA
jgi:DNA modification methylase